LKKNKALESPVILEDIGITSDIRVRFLDHNNFWHVLNVLSNNFFNLLSNSSNLIKPSAEGIQIIEANDAKLSHLVPIFLTIKCSMDKFLEDDGEMETNNPFSFLETQRIAGLLPNII